MFKDTYKLGKKDEFNLIVYYDPDAANPWTKIKIGKSVDGKESNQYLKENNAAILKLVLDHAQINSSLIGKYDLPDDWPETDYNLGYSFYCAIRKFLGDYSYRLITQKARYGGVGFDLENVTIIKEERVLPPAETTIKKDVEIIPTTKSKSDTSDDNRPVTPQKLWNAGRNTYKQSKAGGRRFHLLHVDEQIMPFYSKDDKRANVKGAELPVNVRIGDSEDELSLREVLDKEHGNYYLIGEGGIGKTTALFHIMEQHYERKTYQLSEEIPLFVGLNRAPGVFGRWYKGSEGMQSCFIRMEIGRQLLHRPELADVPDEILKGISEEFSMTPADGVSRYMLLLDGLNEISIDDVTDSDTLVNGRPINGNIRWLLVEEINYLLTECPNVRVILTSRTEEAKVNCTQYGIEKIYLTGLKEKNIREYLARKHFTPEETDAALSDERLLECLVIPLFLTMYANLRDVNGVSSRGEILRTFFHERSQNIGLYTQQDALRNLKFNTYHLWFILDFLLPAIAHEMERREIFETSAKEIVRIIEPILKGWQPLPDGAVPAENGETYDASVIGEYGIACFEKYTSGKCTVETVAEEILDNGKNMAKVEKYVTNYAVDVLKIMCRNKGKYSFLHHHLRDFFAAMHDVNMLRIAVCAWEDDPELAVESLASFTAHKNHPEKSIFIGEILGEYRNKPSQTENTWLSHVPDGEEDRNLLRRSLELFRNKFGDAISRGVYNLLEPIRNVRQDLSGEDLSCLDLSKTNFNGIILGHPDASGANFQGSKLSMDNLLYSGHNGSVKCFVFSPNNDEPTFLSCSTDGTIKEWNRNTKQCICTYRGHNNSVNAIAYAPDGRSFISASDDCTVKEWQVGNPNPIHSYQNHDDCVYSVAFVTDNVFLSGSHDGTVKEWNISLNKCICIYRDAGHWVTALACSPDGKTFLSGSIDGSITEWQIGNPVPIRVYQRHSEWVRCIVFDETGKSFLSGANDGTVKEWQMGITKAIRTYEGHCGWVRSVAYVPGKESFISCSTDGTVREWRIGTTYPFRTYCVQNVWVNFVACAPDGNTFFSASYDGSISEWRFGEQKAMQIFQGCDRRIKCVNYTPDGKSFLIGTFDGYAIEWNLDSAKITHSYQSNGGSVTSIAPVKENDTFLMGLFDGTIKEWRIGDKREIRTYEGHLKPVYSIAYNPKMNTFISGSGDCTVREWRIGNTKPILTYQGHTDWVRSVALSPDGQSFLSASSDGTVKEWRVGKPEAIRTYAGHTAWVRWVAYAPDGKTFLSVAFDGTIKEWHVGNSEAIRTYDLNGEWVRCVAYAHDGLSFLTASHDGFINEWSVGHPIPVWQYHAHQLPVTFLDYSPVGDGFLSSSYDGTVKEWKTGQSVKVFKYYPGLFISCCDMRHLHSDSAFSDEEKEILRQYGAIVE